MYAIFTATATKATNQGIFDMLGMSRLTTFCIVKPPLRKNISYHFHYVSKDIPLENIFKDILNELRSKKQETDRCIIFCQTRKQCSVIYRLFSLSLGKGMFLNESMRNRESFVQMFHAGSPQTVKDYVVQEMTCRNSTLRVLVCTIAFGMGIDCKEVHRSIHFGPSKSVEGFVQETGRLGRDGKQCFSYVLYNGLLTAHCDTQVKSLISESVCHRTSISELFSGSDNVKPEGCLCCDICNKSCDCETHEQLQLVSFYGDSMTEVSKDHKCGSTRRHVSQSQRRELQQKLVEYQISLLPAHTNQFIPAGNPGILMEFGNTK